MNNNSNIEITIDLPLQELIERFKYYHPKDFFKALANSSIEKYSEHTYTTPAGISINNDAINNYRIFLSCALSLYIMTQHKVTTKQVTPYLGFAYAFSLLVPEEKILKMLQDEQEFFKYIDSIGNGNINGFLANFPPNSNDPFAITLGKTNLAIIDNTIDLSSKEFSSNEDIIEFNNILQTMQYLTYFCQGTKIALNTSSDPIFKEHYYQIQDFLSDLERLQNKFANALLAKLNIPHETNIKNCFKALMLSDYIENAQDLKNVSEVYPLIDSDNSIVGYKVKFIDLDKFVIVRSDGEPYKGTGCLTQGILLLAKKFLSASANSFNTLNLNTEPLFWQDEYRKNNYKNFYYRRESFYP